MPITEWTHEHSVGIKVLDDQHKTIFTISNELHDAMKARRGREVLRDILARLLSYTQTHFTEEERLMRLHNYGQVAEHEREHRELLDKVVGFAKRLGENHPLMAVEVADLLNHWISGHIKRMDQGYVPYLKSRGVR